MDFYIFIVGALLLFAALDLIVGVSNDAVNFLNSAIGSRVASYRTIIIIAIAGVVIGSVFSSGIMEIARKGIFYPQHFSFEVILIVFLAVMLTDIILLDVFNSLGLPTSTTVSIIFELLGASFMAGILFTISKNEGINEIWKYINFESTNNIVSGIFLSVLIAFTAGAVIQYLCRLLFTFQFEDKLARYGAVFSGVGITSIVYFLLIKGLKGTTLIDKDTNAWIGENTWLILASLAVVCTLILFIVQKVLKVNPLKIVVLAGTFSLAMAFAGNDLVNFVGVPITGLLAYQNWAASGVPAGEYYMDYLAGNDVIVPNYMLLISGIIMGLTIWLSAKAKKVTETEVNLGRQDEGDERFKANAISRSIVNSSLMFSKAFGILIPRSVIKRYENSFEKKKIKEATETHDTPSFDLVRATTNLVIASSIIAWATSEKLPLSTTYVTFMVAMGSSLADKAWGRDSAVYRVAGVLSVIGGWFVTAFIAFTVSALFALILYKGGETATYILIAIVFAFLIVSHLRFNKKEKESKKTKDRLKILANGDMNTVQKYQSLVSSTVSEIATNYNLILEGLIGGDIVKLESANRALIDLEQHGYNVRSQSIKYIKTLSTNDKQTAQAIILSSDFIQDLAQSTKFLSDEALFYIKNLHVISDQEFLSDLKMLDRKMNHFFNLVLVSLEQTADEDIESIRTERDQVRSFINEKLDFQISNINRAKPSTKEGILQTNVFLQSRDIQAVLMRISKMFVKLYETRMNPSALQGE
ncbi:inorganic phosphate transporter [Planobacterium oryzisoli]|uniref:Phosphate transporter n=1 Tax=Planobacterium oryzisoli TaxID=2771435 RepID=A0A931EB71_9FLAO|nr:inorganic phosphate transporter [Planobacterium oryzisoli]MBF5027833.1 inorganic phosphate transporter [Planobacterium oryzisoli]